MLIINIMINMDDIRQERPDEEPILKLSERLKYISLNKKFGTHVKDSMVFEQYSIYR